MTANAKQILKCHRLLTSRWTLEPFNGWKIWFVAMVNYCTDVGSSCASGEIRHLSPLSKRNWLIYQRFLIESPLPQLIQLRFWKSFSVQRKTVRWRFTGTVVLWLVSTATSQTWVTNVYIPCWTPRVRDNCAATHHGQPWDVDLPQLLRKEAFQDLYIWHFTLCTISCGGQSAELIRTVFQHLSEEFSALQGKNLLILHTLS